MPVTVEPGTTTSIGPITGGAANGAEPGQRAEGLGEIRHHRRDRREVHAAQRPLAGPAVEAHVVVGQPVDVQQEGELKL